MKKRFDELFEKVKEKARFYAGFSGHIASTFGSEFTSSKNEGKLLDQQKENIANLNWSLCKTIEEL